MGERDAYLLEMLRRDGRGDHITEAVCCRCRLACPCFRCEDCFGSELFCKQCMVSMHDRTPLHRIEASGQYFTEWTGNYFKRTSLKALGLRIQLGHPAGERCLIPKTAFHDDFVVIDTHAVHEVALDFCDCATAKSHTKQLLRVGWFPSTSVDPRSAATFRLLETYHILSFESKASAYEFYHTIVRLTDNTGLLKRKDRYEAFMRMVREWRDLKMLKRAGRGHDPAGVDATQSGECAILCPACPQPGKNLPDDWQVAPKARRWLYGLFVAIDANFRLKRRAVSKDASDPGLSRGWAYFVEESAYKAYIKGFGAIPQEKSTCSSHNAVNMADTKSSQGLAATGVGTVDCARHNMKLPNGVGDLQKGERYSNMDYLFFSALRGSPLNVLNVSYDIACQWHKKLWSRMNHIPSHLHLSNCPEKLIRYFVPKFHLPAHILKCQTMFSFNFSSHVGRTDGESPERGWSNINPVASSTKEMGPGSRRDTLDDHFGDWNWKKVVGLGTTLLRKIVEAKAEKMAHRDAFVELDGALKPETTAPWKDEIEKWEDNPNETGIPNPFEAKVTPVTQAATRLKLAQLEAHDLQQGIDVSLHPNVSPSIFISAGLDLEHEQRRLKADARALGQHATATQKAAIQRSRNTLQRKIDAWRRIQALYTPAVQLLRSNTEVLVATTEELIMPEDAPLWLPSAIGNKTACDNRLRSNEWELRYAQAGDALEEIRQSLRLRSHMITFKRNWIRGQSANTRAQNALNRVSAKTVASAEKYSDAHNALTSLAILLGKVGWQATFKKLDPKEDIRAMEVPRKGDSEGRRKMSWIWTVEGVDDCEDEGVHDGLRLEWCKARARAMRWSEEVELLEEEMRRVLQYLRWHATWWDNQSDRRTQPDPAEREGLRAFAVRQADHRRTLAAQFTALWKDHLPTPTEDCSPTTDIHLPNISADGLEVSLDANEDGTFLDLTMPALPPA
ncbi:hypothetical protein BV22DRAFT_1024324 [Leucogyrophana mollusca]|uniref:Uncharacterized protein n=1 Tax=Leucogyrophana mollusca TaxID=85980 RepID=A0ACB8B0G9_9AGAM|nr:hypothetical protein BV22DRAFT_1024324 [Leucogyrophana mollusca]